MLKLEEVRLISALTLPLAWEAGIVAFHPMPCEVVISDNLDLTTEKARNRISQELRRMSKQELAFHDYIRLPPAFGGSHPYVVRGGDLPADLQSRMFEAIDIEDHLFIRGLNAMVRFGILSGYRMFLEEATHALYVGLDASYSIIEREMQAEGYMNPTSYDRMAWLETNAGEELTGNRYLEHYSDDRIRTVHAESRFGAYPFAPLAADDGYLLFYALREVYNFLIFREVVKRPLV
ncbi:MAG: hypothetical protein AB7S71_07885 [Dongiaceae bacterium]